MSYRHSKHRGWREREYLETPLTDEEKELRRAAEEEKVAHVVDYFNSTYGVNGSNLQKWQLLCEDVGEEPGSNILQCQQILDSVHINLVDFVAAMERGDKAYRFESEQALREYIIENHKKIPNKTFPLSEAEQNGFLCGLLIHVWGVFGGLKKKGGKSAPIENGTDVEPAASVDEDIEPEDVGGHVEPEDEGEHVELKDEGEHVELEDVVMVDVEMRDVDMVDVDMLGEET